MSETIANSAHTLEMAHALIDSLYEKHRYIRITTKTGRQRSLKQNSALHVYCKHLADSLNDSGQDMRSVLKEGVDIPWSPETVKDKLWRPIQEAMTGKESTTEPERGDYTKIYEVLNRHTAQKLGISLPFPSNDEAMI